MAQAKTAGNKATGRLDFGPLQLRELTGLGVLGPQIVRLRERLPMIRVWRTKLATLTEVRAAFGTLAKSLEAALDEATAVLTSSPTESATAEVHARLANAAVEQSRSDYPLESLCAALRRELELVGAAQTGLDTGPRRFRSADMRPIAWIEEALLLGWAEAHTGPPLQEGYINLTSMPAFRQHASRSDPFARIAGVCYEASAGVASGADGYSPEASIKTYIAFKKASRER